MNAMLTLIIFHLSLAQRPLSEGNHQSRSDHTTSRIQEEAPSAARPVVSGSRQLMPYALNLIKDFEQWIPQAYDDASQFCTIGYGHLIAKTPCSLAQEKLSTYSQPLSKTVGHTLLDQDTGLARTAIARLVTVQLNEQQFGALVSFVFNVGEKNFATSSLRDYVNAKDFDSAARQFGRWVKSKHRVLDGLVTRRACESALFNGRVPVHNELSFNRSNCSALGAAPATQNLIDIDDGERY